MARLPVPGSDIGTWGDILNDFLSAQHNADGTHNLALGQLTNVDTTGAANGQVLKFNGSTWVAGADLSGGGDPTMGGDLSGTASNAQIVAGAITDAKIAAGAAISQSKVANLTSDLGGKINSSEKGAANGVAQLDGSGKIVPGQLVSANITKLLPYSYTGNLAVSSGTFRLYNDMGSNWTVSGVRASVGVAPAGASIIIDVNKNGTSLFTTQANRPTIVAASNTSGNVTNMDVTTVAPGDYLTIDIDQIGSATAGSDLTVQLEVM